MPGVTSSAIPPRSEPSTGTPQRLCLEHDERPGFLPLRRHRQHIEAGQHGRKLCARNRRHEPDAWIAGRSRDQRIAIAPIVLGICDRMNDEFEGEIARQPIHRVEQNLKALDGIAASEKAEPKLILAAAPEPAAPMKSRSTPWRLKTSFSSVKPLRRSASASQPQTATIRSATSAIASICRRLAVANSRAPSAVRTGFQRQIGKRHG